MVHGLHSTADRQMTMNDLVDEAVRRGADRLLVVSRLRHWVREGLIEPVGQHHPGSGRHRFFEDAALKIALALNALADLNLPVGVLRTAASTLRNPLRHQRSTAPRYLAIIRRPNGKLSTGLHDKYSEAVADSDAFIILDLSKIWGEHFG